MKKVCDQTDGPLLLEGSLLDYEVDDYVSVLRVKRREKDFEYDLNFDWPEDGGSVKKEKEKIRVRDVFLRAGIAKHSNLSHVMERMRNHGDVIIGLDTNILLNCVLTSSLLPEIYEEEFPNWVLFTVPKMVMVEIENKANRKNTGSGPRAGWPDYGGRIGQRALQEIMDLDRKDEDYPGISIMTIGEIEESSVADTANWWKDSSIRSQFQNFLSNISFHKGTYFLSQDRVNVMMSGAEGVEGLYLQKPEIKDFKSGVLSIEKLRELIYELSVQFGEVKINDPTEAGPCFHLSIFWPGKHVTDWEKSRLRIESLKKA